MYRRHSNRTVTFTNEIFQTYLLLGISIIIYLIGAHISISRDLSPFIMLGVIFALVIVIITQSPVFLIVFCFLTGLYHNPLLTYLNIIDPSIINETLQATAMIFFGLTLIAHKTSDYNTFALYGILYSCLSTIIWLCIFNIFYQNVLIDLILMYISIVIFSGYIIVDTHNLLKNPFKSPVIHALHLFLDFMNLFVILLKIMKQVKRKNY